MSRGKYAPEFKTKLVLEVLSGERELGAIAAEHNTLQVNELPNRVTLCYSRLPSKFELCPI